VDVSDIVAPGAEPLAATSAPLTPLTPKRAMSAPVSCAVKSSSANQLQQQMGREADGGGPCSEYRVDMTGARFGDCKCGFPKSMHLMTPQRALPTPIAVNEAASPPVDQRLFRSGTGTGAHTGTGTGGGGDGDGGPCAEYRLDMNGMRFGDCKCGFPKSMHLAAPTSPLPIPRSSAVLRSTAPHIDRHQSVADVESESEEVGASTALRLRITVRAWRVRLAESIREREMATALRRRASLHATLVAFRGFCERVHHARSTMIDPEVLALSQRRARRAAHRCVRSRLAHGLRGMWAFREGRYATERSLRRAARHCVRAQLARGLLGLSANQDARCGPGRRALLARVALAQAAAFRHWRFHGLVQRGRTGWRQILLRRVARRLRERCLWRELRCVADAFFRRTINAPLPSPMVSSSARPEEPSRPNTWASEITRLVNHWCSGTKPVVPKVRVYVRVIAGKAAVGIEPRSSAYRRTARRQTTSEAGRSARWMQIGLRHWRRYTRSSKQVERKVSSFLWVGRALHAIRVWRRIAHFTALAQLASFTNYVNTCSTTMENLKRHADLTRPLERQWTLDLLGLQARRAASRAWTAWLEAAAVYEHRDRCMGRAYSHWQTAVTSRGLRHLHRQCQEQYDARIEMLLQAQSAGTFDIRLLPSVPLSMDSPGSQLYSGTRVRAATGMGIQPMIDCP
jgi:hypothetical protein